MTRHFDNVEMMVKYGFADSFLAEYANHPEEEEEVVQIARCRQNSITVAEEVQQVFQVGPKAHNFVDGIFKIPKKCPFCRQYIWIVHERSKCADCGLPCHRRCQHQFQHDCLPSPKYVKGIFGIDLIRLCMAHAVHIPLVVEKCINEIEARGLEVEGIYRLSCSKSELDELMNKFDAGMVVDLSTIVDINCVAGLLKAFLKKLPSPILPNDIFANMFEYFMDPSNSEAEKQKFCRFDFFKDLL
uniref:Uncharacterized protein n=1 Tax=Panagrolaimus superbus TaxID=310955 RepID=A0A914Z8N6_9BILA